MGTNAGLLIFGAIGVTGAWALFGQLYRAALKWTPLVAVLVAAIYFVVWFVVELVSDVFSLHGLAYSFGFAEAGDLTFPTLVRVATLGGLVEIAVVGSAMADIRKSDRRLRWGRAWLLGHWTLVRRIVVGSAAVVMALLNAVGEWRDERAELASVHLLDFDDSADELGSAGDDLPPITA